MVWKYYVGFLLLAPSADGEISPLHVQGYEKFCLPVTLLALLLSGIRPLKYFLEASRAQIWFLSYWAALSLFGLNHNDFLAFSTHKMPCQSEKACKVTLKVCLPCSFQVNGAIVWFTKLTLSCSSRSRSCCLLLSRSQTEDCSCDHLIRLYAYIIWAVALGNLFRFRAVVFPIFFTPGSPF